jgi:hypothetical protein
MTSPPPLCAYGPEPPISGGPYGHVVFTFRDLPPKRGPKGRQFALVHIVHYNSHAYY